MTSTQINRGGLLGGIGLFLFGMSLFEHTIKQTGKSWLKHTLQHYTNTIPKSIMTGMLQTFVFQSSTIVTMITLGFVGAGIIGLYHALGVVLGANIGSSLTTRLVAEVGFKFSIETYVLPVIGVAGLAMMMTDENHIIHKLSKMALGFSLLFMGLGYMKDSVESMTNTINFASYADRGLWGFIIIGAVATTIIQTSTGVAIITLTALSGGLITLDMSLGIIIGANIGSALSTGMMGILSATRGQSTKKQVAFSQIVFNLVTACIVIPFVQPLKHMILSVVGPNDPETALAMFHTVFNTILIVIRPPILPYYTKYVSKLFIPQTTHHQLMIQSVNTAMPEEFINALSKDVSQLLDQIRQYVSSVLGEHGPVHNQTIIQLYNEIKSDQSIILSMINQEKSSITESVLIQQLDDINTTVLDACASVTGIREILDHCENIVQDVENNGVLYYQCWRDYIAGMIQDMDSREDRDGRHDSLIYKLIQHRQNFMKTIQSNHDHDEDYQFIAELIKTDHYLYNACHQLIDAHKTSL